MRILGHPVHPMVIHFPIALWPAHWVLQLAADRLPAGVAATAGFWLLAAGTALGWFAAVLGLLDLSELGAGAAPGVWRTAAGHAIVNGTVLIGFSILLALEYRRGHAEPASVVPLTAEGLLLVLLVLGNHLGGRLVWSQR